VSTFVNWSAYGGAITSEHKCLPDAPWNNNASCYDFETAIVEHKKVIYIGNIQNCFGHFFTDNLRKVWFLKTAQAKELLEDGAEIVYTTDKAPLIPVAFEIWKMAGVDLSQARLIEKLTRFDVVYVPDNCFFESEDKMFTPEWSEMVESIKANAHKNKTATIKSNNSSKWVYLTRIRLNKGGKTEIGEKEIVRVFEKQGFEIVSPERLSICDQINLMDDCDRLVATEGSIAHLSLFCKPKTEVVILCKANYENSYQDVINEYADLNVTYIESHKSVMTLSDAPWGGPFYLCVTKYLEKFVGHPIPHVPYWLRPSYWKYSQNFLYRSFKKIRKRF
jgi:capsular polysaccharide biosynthesis protein